MNRIRVEKDKIIFPNSIGGLSKVWKVAKHGPVFIALSDGRGRLYWIEDGKRRQKTWSSFEAV